MANLRFQLDEHMDGAVARGLRRAGLDIVTTHEASLMRAPDTVQLAHAHSAGRVMVTQDRDFLRLHRQGVPHSGIAYSPRDSRSIGDLIETLVLMNAIFEPEEMIGRLEHI